MGGHEGGHVAIAGEGKGGEPSDALRPAAVGAYPAQQERDRLRGVHVDDVLTVGLHSDVVAEPTRLFGCVGMAVGVHHQTEVVGRLPVAVGDVDQVGQPKRDDSLAHAVGHGLTEPQVCRIGQGRHQFGDPDSARRGRACHGLQSTVSAGV